jgi:Trypsin-co-occurring domain 2
VLHSVLRHGRSWPDIELTLTKALAVIREQLLDAATRGVGQEIAFVVRPIEMRFAVELRADAKAMAMDPGRRRLKDM